DTGAIKQIEYRRVVRRIGEVVRENLPATATVLVVSKGDDELTRFEGRKAWHFPQNLEGEYTGFAPADSGSALVQLEALRAKGAQYLLLPAPEFSWLDRYTGLKRHLDRFYRLLLRDENCCLIYSLCESPPDQARATSGLEAVIAEYGTRFETEPAI